MVVNPSFPANTVQDFIAYARANPGKINVASIGNGTSPHVVAELFKMKTSISMVHVPYRGGGAALHDLLGGVVQVFFPGVSGYIDLIRSGKLRALAVTSVSRLEVLPDIPPMSDLLPGFEASDVYGIGAPKGTPSDIIEILNSEINAGLADINLNARLVALGTVLLPGSSADFDKLMAAETGKWAKVVRFSGAKPD